MNIISEYKYMAERKEKKAKDVFKESSAAIEEGFKLFSENIKILSEELAEFNRNRKTLEAKIRSGTKRTHGRIV